MEAEGGIRANQRPSEGFSSFSRSTVIIKYPHDGPVIPLCIHGMMYAYRCPFCATQMYACNQKSTAQRGGGIVPSFAGQSRRSSAVLWCLLGGEDFDATMAPLTMYTEEIASRPPMMSPGSSWLSFRSGVLLPMAKPPSGPLACPFQRPRPAGSARRTTEALPKL